MHTNDRTPPAQVVAGKLIVGKLISALCLLTLLLLLPTIVYAADAPPDEPSNASAQLGTPIPVMLPTLADVTGLQEQGNSAATVPTVPTATPSPTITATVTPTPTVTATPTPPLTNVTFDSDGEQIIYEVSFTNNTGKVISGAKLNVEVPSYTNFNLQESTPNWACPSGTTAGFVCTNVWGDIPSSSGEVAAASVNAVWTAKVVLDVLVAQVPVNTEAITFEVLVLDSSGNTYATYELTATLPDPVTVYRVLLPIIRQ